MKHDREVRRYLFAPSHTAWVYSGPGTAEELHGELTRLLPRLITPAGRRPRMLSRRDGAILENIEYRSLLEVVMRTTLAQRVCLQIGAARVVDSRSLAELLAAVRWSLFFRPGASVAVRADSRGSTVYHEGRIRDRTQAALQAAGLRVAASREEDPEGEITVRIERDRARVELSLNGDPLWRRGYRARLTAAAPLREDLAQAAVRFAARSSTVGIGDGPPDAGPSFPDHECLLVPFCGSGTLLFEYLIARFQIPPCLFGREYAFSRLACGVPGSVGWVSRQLSAALAARAAGREAVPATLIDTSAPALAAARENFARFAEALPADTAAARVDWQLADALSVPFVEWVPPEAAEVFIALNPPYGRRLPVASGRSLYARIGGRCDELAGHLTGRPGRHGGVVRGLILCPDEATWKAFSTATPRLSKRTSHFSQGGLDIRMCSFTTLSGRG